MARALERFHVQVLFGDLKLTSREQAEAERKQVLTSGDALVFLVGAGASIKADTKLESEWRSALREQWDNNGSKPMITLLIPPFLRDRQALRLERTSANYDQLAERIVQAAEHPSETMNAARRAQAREEQRERLGELKRFAETLKSVNLSGGESISR